MPEPFSVGYLQKQESVFWRNLMIAAAIVATVVGVVVAGLVYLDNAPPEALSFSGPGAADDAILSLFDRYKIKPLPQRTLADKRVRDALSALAREPCEKSLIYEAALALQAAGRRREVATMLLGFVDSCPEPYGELGSAGEILYGLGDYSEALKIANRLIKMNPGPYQYFYLQARALQGLGRFEEALDSYSVAIRLFGDVKQVRADVFASMAASYAALGRFCEAMSPIETYIAADSEARESRPLRSTIEDYARQGDCAHAYAVGSEQLPRHGNGVISAIVEINGVTGVFTVDTGASFVSVTRDFAKRAKLSPLKASPTQLTTANGDVEALLTSIPNLRVGRLRADAVPGVILNKPLGQKTDGLLGMSFLARYDVEILEKEVRIKEKRRN